MATQSNPGAICDLIADAAVYGVALVLRIPEAAVGLGESVGGVAAQEKSDLVEFMRTLTSESYSTTVPVLPR